MRSLLIAIVWAGQLLGNCQGNTLNDLPFAPSRPTEDEQAAADHSGFQDCEAVMAMYADRSGDRMADRTYTVSKQWGKVLRAKAIMTRHGRSSTALVTCWTGSGPGVRIFVDFYTCAGQQRGC